MSAKKTTLRILSSLKPIIDDFSCPICSEPCTDTLVNPACGHRFCGKCIKAAGEGNRNCPTCGAHIAAFQSCRADLYLDRILEKVVTDLVFPLLVAEKRLSTNGNRPQKDETVGSTAEAAAQLTLDDVCAQNQVNGVIGSRKRHRSPQEQQFLSTTTATTEEAIHRYNNDNGAIGERRRKALKTNEAAGTASLAGLRSQHNSHNQIVTRTDNAASDSCSSQVRCSHIRRERPTASCEKNEIKTVITSNKKNSERHEPSEELTALQEQGQSPSKFSNQSVTTRNKSNPSHASFVAKQNVPACFEFSGMSHATFQKRIEELRAFRAKFGHCSVTQSKSTSNKPYMDLGNWCFHVRQSRMLMEKGKPVQRKLSKAQIETLDALGFQWEVKSPFEDRIEELKAFKAKFGHCNVTQSKSTSNKPYYSLGNWCGKVRYSRRLIEEGKPTRLKLTETQIESLDALGFQWDSKRLFFNRRIADLKAFKAKFGHCNVTCSRSTSNQPYMDLGKWCNEVRRSRRLVEDGEPVELKLSKAQIETLNALGFQWKSKSRFDKRIEELRAFKAKFGHYNLTLSKSTWNKPYHSLGRWCNEVRRSRRLMEEGKPADKKLYEAQIETLDALGFSWTCHGHSKSMTQYPGKHPSLPPLDDKYLRLTIHSALTHL